MNLSNRTCVLCSAPSTPEGEQVLPAWLKSRLFPPDTTYTTSRNGQPVGAPQNNFGQVQAPMCIRHNDLLNRRFENPLGRSGRDEIAAFFAGSHDAISIATSDLFRLWILKTWILAGHSETVYSSRLDQDFDRAEVDRHWLNWVATGNDPPQGLNAWIVARPEPDAGHEVFGLASIRRDTTQVSPLRSTLGLAGRSVHVVGQYLHGVQHPWEEGSGGAIRIFPGDGPVSASGLSEPCDRSMDWATHALIEYPTDVDVANLPQLPCTNPLAFLAAGAVQITW